jgi:hypothetical protein
VTGYTAVTQDQKEKLGGVVEGAAKSLLFQGVFRAVVLFATTVGGPIIYFAVTSTYREVISLHDQQNKFQGQIERVIDQASNDRTNSGNQFKDANDRITQLSKHIDEVRAEERSDMGTIHSDYALKNEVLLGFQTRDHDILALDSRLRVIEHGAVGR